MENASKALVIAGAILVSIILVSLGIVVIDKVKSQINNNANITSEEVQAFNSKFDTYLGNINGTEANQLRSLCKANGVVFDGNASYNASDKLKAEIESFYDTDTDKGTENYGKIKKIKVSAANP